MNVSLASRLPDLYSFDFTAAHTPNPKHKMSYHHQNKNRNAENASYMHVQRDSVRTVTLNAPPRSRPTTGSYNKADVNKEPKLNLCPGEGLYWCGSLLTALGLRVGFPTWIADLWSSHSLLLLGQYHYNILDTNPEDRIQEESGTCFKGHGRILTLEADELALHLLRDLPPLQSSLFTLGSFISRGRIIFTWLTFSCSTKCAVQLCLSDYHAVFSWGHHDYFLERVSLRVNCNISDNLSSLPPCPSKSFHLVIGKGMVLCQEVHGHRGEFLSSGFRWIFLFGSWVSVLLT